MDKRQATAESVETSHAARTSVGSDTPETDDGFELPPPPAPGALWATPSDTAPAASNSAPASAPPAAPPGSPSVAPESRRSTA